MKILPRLFVLALVASAFGLEIKAQKTGVALKNTFAGVEGNWEMQFQGGSAAGRAQVSIWPKKIEGGVKSEWQVACRYFGGPSDGEAHLKVDAVSANGVTLKRYDWYYHQDDADYNTITLSLDSPDSMSGVWINNEGKRGGVIARRVYPEITRVEFYSSMPTRASWMRYKSPEHHISDLPGEMPVAEFTYKASGWGPSNNMRGNRPQILVKFYGKNMWGVWRSRIEENTENFEFQTPGNYVDTYLYRIYSEREKPRSLIGRNLVVHLWGEPKPGRLTFNINGVAIPFDFVVHGYPPPPIAELLLVDRDGRRIELLREGDVFAMEARFEEDNDLYPHQFVDLLYPSDRFVNYRLDRQADQKIFRSPYQQLLDSAARTPDITGDIPPEMATSIARHFSGSWIIRNLTTEGASYLGGQVTMGLDGKSGAMVLNEMDHADRYVLLAAAVDSPSEGTAMPAGMTALFREDVASSPIGDGDVYPFYRHHDAKGSIRLRVKDLETVVPVEWSEASKNANAIEFRFSRTEKMRLEGEWRSEQKMASHGNYGASWWTRGVPRIREVIVLEDQTSPNGAFAYPSGERAGAPATNLRRLLVLGENLPARQGTQAQAGTVPVSEDAHLRYGDFAVDAQTRELLMRRIFDETGRERPNDPDQLFVRAEFDPEVKAGNKTLSLGSATGEWPLQFNNDNADLRFTRDRNFAKSDEVAVFFPDDTAFVTLDLDFDSHLTDSRKVELALIGISPERKMKLLGRVAAMRVEDETKPTFRSRGIIWVKPTAEVSALTEQGGGFLVPVPEGWRVAVRAVDPAITADPAVATVQVPDDEVGQLWLKTLERVAAVPGVKGDIKKPKEFAMERGVVFSKGVYASRLISWDWGNNDVQLLNGSHAAALLIRDEFVRQMRQLLPKYIAQAKDPKAIRAFYEKALANPRAASRDSFWKNNEITHIRFPFGLPLAEVLDLDYLAKERLGVSRIEAMDWTLKEVASALEKQVDNMGAAIVRAEAAKDRNLDEIMVFAGYQAPTVIQEITSKLVVKKEGRWVPDDQAIRFVKGLYVPGQAIRSLKAYSDIDNAYNAMAVAVVTFGSSAALSAGGYATAAAYTSFIGNALDAAVVGGSGVKDYVVGERNFDTAMGAAPLLGNEIVDEAEAMRKSLLGAAAGVLLPSLGAAGDLAGLGQAGRISRGKALAEGPTGRNLNLDSLDDAGKADLLAYYDDLLKRRYGLGRSEGTVNPLSPEEAATYENLKSQFARKATSERLAKMTPEERQAYHDNRATAETSEKFRRGDHLEDGGEGVLPGRVTEPEVGSLSRNYTDDQLRRLEEPGRNLTREELMVKADAYRAGRLGPRSVDETPTVHLPNNEPSTVRPPADDSPTVGLSPDDTPTVVLSPREMPTMRLPADESPTVGLPSTETPTVGLPVKDTPTVGLTPDETSTVRLPSPGAPTVRTPAREAPENRLPSDEAPTVGLAPDEAPTVKLSPREMPTMRTPAGENPSVGLPAKDTPTVGLTPDETPTVRLPSPEAPTVRTPAHEAPTQRMPADETPTVGLTPDETPTVKLSPREMPTMRTPPGETPTVGLPAKDTPTVGLKPEDTPTVGLKPGESSVAPIKEKPLSEMTPAERQAFHDQKATAETSEKFRRGDHLEDGGDDILPGRVTEPEVGYLSRNYTDEQLRRLEEPGRNLTREEIRIKADAYRAGRLGPQAANDTPTVGLPATDTPTVGLPADHAPTVGLSPDDTPTVVLSPREMPTMRTSPEDVSPTVGLTPDETPTVRLPSPDAPTVRTPARETPTTRLPANENPTVGLTPDEKPTVKLTPREMPTMRTSPEEAAPSVRLRPEESPTKRMAPDEPPLTIRSSDDTRIAPKSNSELGAEPAVDAGKTMAPPSRDVGSVKAMSPDDGMTKAPPVRSDPMDASTGAFGQNPVDPAAIKRPLPVDPEAALRGEMRRTTEAAYTPHQGRQVVDDMKEAEHQFFRQREVDDLEAQLEVYRFDSPHPKNSPEYEAGLEEVRHRWRADLERMDLNFERHKQALLRDHEVMDDVESFLGNRTYNDYFTLELERGRPDRALTKEEAVLGTLFNRHSRSDFPHLQGTPEQHRAALEASGLNREQVRGLLKHWIDPLDKTDPASVDRAVTRYLDWTGF